MVQELVQIKTHWTPIALKWTNKCSSYMLKFKQEIMCWAK